MNRNPNSYPLDVHTRTQQALENFDLRLKIIMSSSPEENQTSAFRPFTKAERIQQLNEIDKVRSATFDPFRNNI